MKSNYKYKLQTWHNHDAQEVILSIEFLDKELITLGHHLSWMHNSKFVKNTLNMLIKYQKHPSKAELVDAKYNNYWNHWELEKDDWTKYTLNNENNDKAKIFTLYGYDNGLNLIVREIDEMCILEDEYQQNPLVFLKMDILIKILDRWMFIKELYEQNMLKLPCISEKHLIAL